MSKEDIEKAVKDAEQYAAEDKKRREEVDTKNEAENLCYQAEKLVKENGDKLSEEDKNALNTKISATKAAIEQNSVDAIKMATEDMQKTLYDISAKLYQQANPQGAQNPQGTPDMGGFNQAQSDNTTNNGGDNVYDADFTDVD